MSDAGPETTATSDARLDWVEPEMIELNIAETAVYPHVGADGQIYPDCTRS